jgi:formamidopyrimidine-DNA glycosylase
VPEGHTIHRLARDVRRAFVGHQVAVTSPQGRFAHGASVVDGQTLLAAEAHGKHLFLAFGVAWVHVHLGLFGRVSHGVGSAPTPTGAVRMRLQSPENHLDLRGPTACALLDDAAKDALQARLGADPLRRDADPDVAYAAIRRRRLPIGALLLDQSIVAGIGNVYRAELLHRAGISPFRPSGQLSEAAWVGLWDDMVTVMRAGVRSGRIVTTEREHRERPSGRARRVDAYYVYKRGGLPCRRCGSEVAGLALAARTVFWCPTCQNS